ncbi:MAG TPA: hypothetical protein VNU71_14335 [Burkholderiaceae bacterium]|nr:hypothetical protein [Burkholderiaceae bacterium]
MKRLARASCGAADEPAGHAMNNSPNRRIPLIDDMLAIREDFRQILMRRRRSAPSRARWRPR